MGAERCRQGRLLPARGGPAVEASPWGGTPRPWPLLLLLQLLGLSLRGMGTGSAGCHHGVLHAPTGLGTGAVTVNKRQRCSVGGEWDRVHVGAGWGENLGILAAMGLSSGEGWWRCLLQSPLGRGHLGME